MALTRFSIAKKDIIKYFDDGGRKIYTFNDLSTILNENRAFWRLSSGFSTRGFIKELLKSTKMLKHEMQFPNIKYTRYTWGQASVFELTLSINNYAYLSHYTAIYLHNLTEQIPKSIYVNVEQTYKGKLSKSELEQGRIDFAFSRKQRTTNNIAIFGDYRVCLLNGKNTDNLGVIEMSVSKSESLRVTSLERTLIDITVRPVYSGGVFEVLNAYKFAAGLVSINKLAATLKKLNYVYPYHQCIGFYLEEAGIFKEHQIEILKRFEMKYDFYLTYGIEEKNYSKKWRLYYPKELG